MQLSTYLQREHLTREQFARLIGVSPVTVYRWLTGDRFPYRHLDQITKATGGKVTANDFVKLRGSLSKQHQKRSV